MEIKDFIDKEYQFILIGCEVSKEREALSECWHVLVKYCSITPLEVFELAVRGLVLIVLESSAEASITKIGSIVENNLFQFQMCKTFTPLEYLTESSLENLTAKIPAYLRKMPNRVKWKVAINRRHSTIARADIIESIVNLPDCPKGTIDLENPTWQVNVEVIGSILGFSVCQSKNLLKINKLVEEK